MKRLLAILLLAALPPAATAAADPVTIVPGVTFAVPTTAGTATAVALPAVDGQTYLVLTVLGADGRQTVVPLVAAPFGAAPVPGPGPSPGPGPAPSPVVGKLYVLAVTESRDQTPEQAAVLNAKAVEDYVAAKGWAYRKADQDTKDQNGQVPSDLANWLNKAREWVAKGNKLPYLVVHDANGAIAHEGPLPTTEADFLAILKRFGG